VDNGTLAWILSALSLSCKIIANKVRRAQLDDVLGTAGSDNVQGEQQQKLGDCIGSGRNQSAAAIRGCTRIYW
jgi:fructose-1,6-bisphosphatase I